MSKSIKGIAKNIGYVFYLNIIKKFFLKGKDERDTKLYQRMQSLYIKKDVSEEWKEYQSCKYAYILTGVLIAVIFIVLYIILPGNGNEIVHELERPSYNEDSKVYSIEAKDDTGNKSTIDIEVMPKLYSETEVFKAFDDYYKLLKKNVLGDNKSMKEVVSDLNFSPLEDWNSIDISWSSSSSVISSEGKLVLDQLEDKSEDVLIYLTMRHGDFEKKYEIPVTVLMSDRYNSEFLKNYIEKNQETSRTKDSFVIPESFNEKNFTYSLDNESNTIFGIILLVIAVSGLMVYRKNKIIDDEYKKREQQLKKDYPDIISRLSILMRAGIPVKGAWIHMVNEYQKDRKKGRPYCYAMEEMTETVLAMKNGLSEGEAYLQFGKRCGLLYYIKLGGFLEQNLKKGNQRIAVLLENERVQALEQRRRHARESGEVAGGKLMLPMMVLFALVMVIIMVPSFMSFGI